MVIFSATVGMEAFLFLASLGTNIEIGENQKGPLHFSSALLRNHPLCLAACPEESAELLLRKGSGGNGSTNSEFIGHSQISATTPKNLIPVWNKNGEQNRSYNFFSPGSPNNLF